MTGPTTAINRLKIKPMIGLLIAFGFVLFIAANAHLLYVAISSQPECVTHLRHGEGKVIGSSFSAAVSSCSSKAAKPTNAQAE